MMEIAVWRFVEKFQLRPDSTGNSDQTCTVVIWKCRKARPKHPSESVCAGSRPRQRL